MNAASGTINCCHNCLLSPLFIRLNALRNPSLVESCINFVIPRSITSGVVGWIFAKSSSRSILLDHDKPVTTLSFPTPLLLGGMNTAPCAGGTLYHTTVVTGRQLSHPQPATLEDLNVTAHNGQSLIHPLKGGFNCHGGTCLLISRHAWHDKTNNNKLSTNKQLH